MSNLKLKSFVLFIFLTAPAIGFCGSMQYLCGLIQPNGMLKVPLIFTQECSHQAME